MEAGRILGIAYNVIPVTNIEKSAEWFVNTLDSISETKEKVT